MVSPYPEEILKGIISYISDVIDPETRSVKVRMEVENRKGFLKPEMFATVRITASEKEKALAIPDGAVQRDGDKSVVFVEKEKGEFEKRTVVIAPQLDGYHRVVSGVKQGERIVSRRAFTLKSEGQKREMTEGGG